MTKPDAADHFNNDDTFNMDRFFGRFLSGVESDIKQENHTAGRINVSRSSSHSRLGVDSSEVKRWSLTSTGGSLLIDIDKNRSRKSFAGQCSTANNPVKSACMNKNGSQIEGQEMSTCPRHTNR